MTAKRDEFPIIYYLFYRRYLIEERKNNPLSQEEYYRRLLSGYLDGKKDNKIKTIFSFLENIRNLKVLDAGCGTGIITKELSKNGADVISIDVNELAIEFTKKSLKKENMDPNKIIRGDVQYLPFKDKSFDIVVSTDIIEHLLHPEFFFFEARRILKENGRLLVSTDNLWLPLNSTAYIYLVVSKIKNFMKNSSEEDLYSNYGVPHINLFSPFRLYRFIRKFWFELKKWDTFFFKKHSGKFSFWLDSSVLSKLFRRHIITISVKKKKFG